MSTAEPTTSLMSAEEFMALPDDGKERWLLDGVVYTLEDSMTVRNRVHSAVAANVTGLLRDWVRSRPAPRGCLHCGDAGFRLGRNPEVLVGADVAYASAELVAATPAGQAFYEGAPTLAVEILSPSDRHEDLVEKIRRYLNAGSTVWVIDADLRNVMVHRPGGQSRSFCVGEELTTEPELPGFHVPVSDLFDY